MKIVFKFKNDKGHLSISRVENLREIIIYGDAYYEITFKGAPSGAINIVEALEDNRFFPISENVYRVTKNKFEGLNIY